MKGLQRAFTNASRPPFPPSDPHYFSDVAQTVESSFLGGLEELHAWPQTLLYVSCDKGVDVAVTSTHNNAHFFWQVMSVVDMSAAVNGSNILKKYAQKVRYVFFKLYHEVFCQLLSMHTKSSLNGRIFKQTVPFSLLSAHIHVLCSCSCSCACSCSCSVRILHYYCCQHQWLKAEFAIQQFNIFDTGIPSWLRVSGILCICRIPHHYRELAFCIRGELKATPVFILRVP